MSSKSSLTFREIKQISCTPSFLLEFCCILCMLHFWILSSHVRAGSNSEGTVESGKSRVTLKKEVKFGIQISKCGVCLRFLETSRQCH